MRVVVVEASDPVLTPADIPGKHAADDALVAAMIAAATSNIDGPEGWLGRSIGAQTLEASGFFGEPTVHLPFPPVIEVLGVVHEDATGAEVEVPAGAATWRFSRGVFTVAVGAHWVTQPGQRVRYRAGYGEVRDGVLTSEVPAPIKAAIVLMTVGLLVAQERDGGLRSFQVDGAFTKQFNSPELMDRVRTVTVDRLLAPFRVFF